MNRALFVVLGGLAIASSAHAEPNFPEAIQSAGNIPCAPPCTLCHTTTPGTAQTATKAFAITVITNGLRPRDPDSLNTVVAKLRTDKVDTDGDGVLDVDELAAGTDPSNPRPDAQLCGPLYGCAGGHIAKVPPRHADPAAWFLASALALVLLSRMRRPRSALAPSTRAPGSK